MKSIRNGADNNTPVSLLRGILIFLAAQMTEICIFHRSEFLFAKGEPVTRAQGDSELSLTVREKETNECLKDPSGGEGWRPIGVDTAKPLRDSRLNVHDVNNYK